MFPQQYQNLDELMRSNHRRFVHPGQSQPEWVRRAAEQHEALALLQADRRAAKGVAGGDGGEDARPGFLRRLLPFGSRA